MFCQLNQLLKIDLSRANFRWHEQVTRQSGRPETEPRGALKVRMPVQQPARVFHKTVDVRVHMRAESAHFFAELLCGACRVAHGRDLILCSTMRNQRPRRLSPTSRPTKTPTPKQMATDSVGLWRTICSASW